MDEPWKQLPRAAVMVYVGVLAAGTSRPAQADEGHALASAPTPRASSPISKAPTCGPACHGGRGAEAEPVPTADPEPTPPPDVEPIPETEPDPIAPTCGPSCHGGDDGSTLAPELAPAPEPPPTEPSKRGCTVAAEADVAGGGLALLGLGLVAGAARRRRSRDDARS